mgnify:CR=1 FL=1
MTKFGRLSLESVTIFFVFKGTISYLTASLTYKSRQIIDFRQISYVLVKIVATYGFELQKCGEIDFSVFGKVRELVGEIKYAYEIMFIAILSVCFAPHEQKRKIIDWVLVGI